MQSSLRRSGLSLAALALLLCMCTPVAFSQQLTVAAAADLNYALKDLAARFARSTGTKVDLSFGASGNLYSQIQNGAPYDLFFSADAEYPRKLAAAGLIDAASVRTYAVGHLVLWAPGMNLRAQQPGDKELKAFLLRPEIIRVAIANPEHAPYGRVAMAVLEHLEIADRIKDKLVLGENVSQAAQFVQSGNAQLGFVPLSLLQGTGDKTSAYWTIPQQDYPELQQVVGIVSISKNKKGAQAFLDYVGSPEGTAVLQHYGFGQPKK